MGNTMTARDLVRQIARAWGRDPVLVERALADAPLDFPVAICDRLPLGVHRRGMSGITLRGRVYLHRSVMKRSAVSIIALLRHEAEHVRQQRLAPVSFYIRYVGEWFGALARLLVSPATDVPRWRRAYMMIGAEQEAYEAETQARTLLEEIVTIEVGQIVQRMP